jgi:phosphoglycolate phosphatase
MVFLHYDAHREKQDMLPLKENFLLAYKESKLILNQIDFSKYEKVIFLSKSLGTIIAGQYASEKNIPNLTQVFFTPVDKTLPYINKEDLIFAAEKDSYMEDTSLKLASFPHAHILPIQAHSLEDKEDELHSLKILETIMTTIQDFFQKK